MAGSVSELEVLWRRALYLRRHAPKRKGRTELLALGSGLWPALWFVTDPARVLDVLAAAQSLPPGCGIVYRGFGRPEAQAEAQGLADIARRRRLVLLIGLDDRLALAVGAHGVHLPERDMVRARSLRRSHPDWIITCATHSARAIWAAGQAGVDAVFLSAVFPSNSPSAGRALGPPRFAALARASKVPVFALGGVRKATIARLNNTGAAGVAAVEGIVSKR